MVRKVMLVLALVVAFQAGRLMPARTAWSTLTYPATAYAQAPPEGTDLDPCAGLAAEEPGSEAAIACQERLRLLDAFADQVAYETLLQLAARAPAISEALRLEMSELTAVIQERLGPEVEQLQGQVLTSQALMARSQAVLNRSDRTLNRSEDVIDDSKETLDESEDVLDESEDVLDDSADVIDDSEELLEETRRTLERSRALLEETEQVAAEAQELARRLAEDIEDVRAILDASR